MMRSLCVTILCLGMAGPAVAAEMAMPMKHGAAAGTFQADNEAAMAAMMKGMSVKPSGNPDKDFARMMLAHHQGAIAMAQLELKYGKDPEMRALATAIVAAQEKEIALMQGWLAKP